MINLKANLSDYPPPDPIFRQLLAPPCAACGLSPLRSNGCSHKVVPPIGDIRTAKILVCLQSPGETEDHYGLPVCGPQHFFLQDLAKAMGFSGLTSGFWDQVVVANAVWCHPEGNRKAQSRELAACSRNMTILMRAMDVRLVVAAGADALVMFEGSLAEIKYRNSSPGTASWRDPDTSTIVRTFKTYPMYHPARKDKFKNEWGRRRAHQEYATNIKWIAHAANLIKSGQDSIINPCYQYEFCETETESLGRAEALRDSKPLHLGVDFETWSLYAVKQPIGLAISAEALSGIYFPMLQTVRLPESQWHFDKSENNSPIQIEHGYTSYFSENYPAKLMEILRPLFEGEDRPFVTAQHAQIEMSCFDTYGIKFLPRPEQILGDPEIPCFDLMPLTRIALMTTKADLETALQVAMPLEWTTKGKISKLMSKNEKKTTGFGMYSIKPPGLLSDLKKPELKSAKEKKASWWGFELDEPKIVTLAMRAVFDADSERRLDGVLREMAFGETLSVQVDPESLFRRQHDDT